MLVVAACDRAAPGSFAASEAAGARSNASAGDERAGRAAGTAGAAVARREPLTPAVRARVETVARAFSERGARALDAEWSTFVAPGEAESTHVHIERAQCLGFAAIGASALRKVSLRVHDASGVLLGELAEHPHPYVRLCVRDDARLTVVVRAVEGQGQLALLLLAQPPLVAPDLGAALGEHHDGGLTGPRTPRAAVGADPAIEALPDALDRHRARMSLLGYRAMSPPQVLTVDRRAPLERRFELEAGRCYGVLLASDGFTDALTVEITAPDGQVLVGAHPVDRDPLTRGCVPVSGAFTVRLTAREETRVAMQALTLEDPLALPPDIIGAVRVGLLELHGEALSRSLHRVRSVQRVASVGAPLVQTLTVYRDHCALIGAATSGAPVELSLNDAGGTLIASDTSATATPRVWYCAARTQELRLTARPIAARGEFALAIFEDGGAP